jgi:hypothetical protein
LAGVKFALAFLFFAAWWRERKSRFLATLEMTVLGGWSICGDYLLATERVGSVLAAA